MIVLFVAGSLVVAAATWWFAGWRVSDWWACFRQQYWPQPTISHAELMALLGIDPEL